MTIERGTTSLWIAKQTYKRFAKVCKRFNFQISEILEDFMSVFIERYPLEDPEEMQYIQAPAFIPQKRDSPNVREEINKGLMKWITVFVCPGCGEFKHVPNEMLKLLEEKGIQPMCPKCKGNMAIEVPQ